MPPFLSRNLTMMCFTRERNLKYQEAILGPGHKNVMALQKHSLHCTPRMSLSSRRPGLEPCFSRVRASTPAAWLLGPAEANGAAWVSSWGSRWGFSSTWGFPRLWGHSLGSGGVVFEELWWWHSIVVWPINISYFCPSHITSPRHLKCWRSTQTCSVWFRGLLPLSFPAWEQHTGEDTDMPLTLVMQSVMEGWWLSTHHVVRSSLWTPWVPTLALWSRRLERWSLNWFHIN